MSLCRLALQRAQLSLQQISFSKQAAFLSFCNYQSSNEFLLKKIKSRTFSIQNIPSGSWRGYGKSEESNNRYFTIASLGLCSFMFWKSGDAEKECKEEVKIEKVDLWKDMKVTLYQYQTCPFCTKTRTFLQYSQVPFEIVEVHPIFKKEIKFSEKYKKVPIVTIETGDGKHELQDSSLIISILSTYINNGGKRSITEIMSDYPASEVVDEDGKTKEVVLNKYWILIEEPDKATTITEEDPRQIEAKWRRWTDDHLVHLISPNVYRTLPEAYGAFSHHVELGKFKGTWEGWVAKVFGALAMWMISKKLKKKYCSSDDVRIDLYKACNEWRKALGKKKFMGGDEPNLADLSVYAVINVMDGLVSFDDIAQHTKIQPWYERVKNAIKEKQAEVNSDDMDSSLS